MNRIVGMAIVVALAGCGQTSDSKKAPVESVSTSSVRSVTLALGGLRVRAPARASDVLRVERAHAPGVFVDVTAIGAREVTAVRKGNDRATYPDAFADTELVHVLANDRVEELRHVARPGEDRSLHYRIELGPGLQRLRVVSDFVEALDHDGVARLRTEVAYVVDSRGTKRTLDPTVELREGAWALDYAVDDHGLEYPITIDPAWTPTSFLAKERRNNALHVLPSGKVITIGGLASDGGTNTTEIYDPATSSWTSGGTLLVKHFAFASVMLSTGKIFIAGGGFGGAGIATKAELFDPVAGTSTALADSPDLVDLYPVALVLPGNKIFLTGSGGVQIYDVTTNTWTISSGAVARAAPTAAVFGTSKVLVAGGGIPGTSDKYLSSAQIYDATSATWKSAASMSTVRMKAETQTLSDGRVLVAGGWQGWTSAEIYDPSTDKWTATPPMKGKHAFAGSVTLSGGKILVVAGDEDAGVTDAVDLFDPATTTWVSAGIISSGRDDFALVALPAGKVLIAGGSNGAPTNIVEIFDPMAIGKACIGPGECASGFCVESVCCEKAACAADETCAGTGTPGKCARRNGEICTGDAGCASGHCADGFCCDTACTDVCAACDVSGQKGKCVPVAAGDAPHGKRTACPGSGVCIGKCGGVDPTKCTQFPGTAITCAAASCASGTESHVSGCDGAGACAKPITRACDAYECGPAACKTQCDGDADCASGNQCDLVSRKCVLAATCSDDHTVKSPDGNSKDCTPFRCVGSRCAEECTSSDSCVAGYACDTASKRCVVAATATEDSSGCGVGGRGTNDHGASAYLGALSALLAARFRRRRALNAVSIRSR